MTRATISKPRAFRRGYTQIPEDWSQLARVPWGSGVVIEVGSGTGEWICAEATRNPTLYYIGIEQTEVRSTQFIQRAKAPGNANLTAIRADAVLLLDVMCPPDAVDAIYFYYPNPYPKSRQANRRLLLGPSMWVFDRCLKPGGQLYLATNIGSYAEETTATLHQAWGYSVTRHGPITAPMTPRTAFEKKYLERGETLFEVAARKSL